MYLASQCECVPSDAIQNWLYVIQGSAESVQEYDVPDVGFQWWVSNEAPGVEEEGEDAQGLCGSLGNLPSQSAQGVWVGVAIEVLALFPRLSDATPQQGDDCIMRRDPSFTFSLPCGVSSRRDGFLQLSQFCSGKEEEFSLPRSFIDQLPAPKRYGNASICDQIAESP